MSETIAFWLGVAITAAVFYYSTHPEKRSALFSRIKALFETKDAP